MANRGYNTYVHRTDVDPEQYVGQFADDKDGQGWVDRQTEGTYEVSGRRPTRTERVVSTPQATEEVAHDNE